MTHTYTMPKEFTINEIEQFKEELYALISDDPLHLTIDFTACSFIDSTGLGAIVSVFKRLNQQNGSLVLRNMDSNIRNLFHMTRLDHVMTIE